MHCVQPFLTYFLFGWCFLAWWACLVFATCFPEEINLINPRCKNDARKNHLSTTRRSKQHWCSRFSKSPNTSFSCPDLDTGAKCSAFCLRHFTRATTVFRKLRIKRLKESKANWQDLGRAATGREQMIAFEIKHWHPGHVADPINDSPDCWSWDGEVDCRKWQWRGVGARTHEEGEVISSDVISGATTSTALNRGVPDGQGHLQGEVTYVWQHGTKQTKYQKSIFIPSVLLIKSDNEETSKTNELNLSFHHTMLWKDNYLRIFGKLWAVTQPHRNPSCKEGLFRAMVLCLLDDLTKSQYTFAMHFLEECKLFNDNSYSSFQAMFY